MKKSAIIITIISVVAVLICLKASLYVVDVRLQAVITQFGKPVRVVTEPGLYVKSQIF
ncbi:MAG: hypothetical protein HYV59_15590 [Planctomycetes bacterium]|nr:hypothetical protein [Planctomycetota bacterium]